MGEGWEGEGSVLSGRWPAWRKVGEGVVVREDEDSQGSFEGIKGRDRESDTIEGYLGDKHT